MIVLTVLDDDSGSWTHIKAWCSGLLLLFWLVGALIMTFHEPFKATSNGYFAAWTCLGCAWLLCTTYFQVLQGLITGAGDYGYDLSAIVFAGLVLLLQAVVDVTKETVDKDLHWGFAIICPILTLVLACLIAKHNE